jgi:hypothetical protein
VSVHPSSPVSEVMEHVIRFMYSEWNLLNNWLRIVAPSWNVTRRNNVLNPLPANVENMVS